MNGVGQLGIGTTVNAATPTSVKGVGGVGVLTNVVAMAAGQSHTLALRSDGTVVAWGSNSAGTLGNGGVGGFSTVPVQVVGPGGVGVLTDIVAVSAGFIPPIIIGGRGLYSQSRAVPLESYCPSGRSTSGIRYWPWHLPEVPGEA